MTEHSLVFQYGCQTALDAFIRGIPSVKPNRGDANVWSRVTPYIDPIILREKISDIKFLNEILDVQKKLFDKYKIDQLLYNLNQPFRISQGKDLINNTEQVFLKERGIKEISIFNFLKFKYFLKSILKPDQLQEIRRSLTSIDINNFLEDHYLNKNWSFCQKKCIVQRN